MKYAQTCKSTEMLILTSDDCQFGVSPVNYSVTG